QRDETRIRAAVLALNADRHALCRYATRHERKQARQFSDILLRPQYQLEHSQLLARAAFHERSRMEEGEARYLAIALQEQRVAQSQLLGELQLARIVIAWHELVREAAAGFHRAVSPVARERAQERRVAVLARGLQREGQR